MKLRLTTVDNFDWFTERRVLTRLGIGDWFTAAYPSFDILSVGSLVALVHPYISNYPTWVNRAMFRNRIDGAEAWQLETTLNRLHAQEADSLWAAAIILTLFYLAGDDWELTEPVARLTRLRTAKDQQQTLALLLDQMDQDSALALAGHIAANVDVALSHAWRETPDTYRSTWLPVDVATPPGLKLPQTAATSLSKSDAPEYVGFTDPEDFPCDMQIFDLRSITPTETETLIRTEWSALQGYDEHIPELLASLPRSDSSGDLQKVGMLVRCSEEYETESGIVLLIFDIHASRKPGMLHFDLKLAAWSGNVSNPDNVAIAAIMTYWDSVIYALHPVVAPGDDVAVHLSPNRDAFDAFMMKLELNIIWSPERVEDFDRPVHGLRFDVRRGAPGECDPMPLLGCHVSPQSTATGWDNILSDLHTLAYSNRNEIGVASLIVDADLSYVAYTPGGEPVEAENLDNRSQAALARVTSFASVALAEDFKRRYGWVDEIVVTYIIGAGLFLLHQEAWRAEEWIEGVVIAHYPSEPSKRQERDRARLYWSTFPHLLQDYLNKNW